MKKIFSYFLMMALVISLTACDSADYSKAIDLYNSEKYSEAIAIFNNLGNYKDSFQMLLKCKYEMALDHIDNKEFDSAKELLIELDDYENCSELLKDIPWNSFYEYLKNEGNVKIESTSPEYTVTLVTKGADIVASYVTGSADTALYANFCVTLTKEGANNVLEAYGLFKFLNAYMEDKASTDWDINSYKQGDDVSWDIYSCTGKKSDGQPLDVGTNGVCYDAKSYLKQLTDGIKKALDKSGLDVKMNDIGFNCL